MLTLLLPLLALTPAQAAPTPGPTVAGREKGAGGPQWVHPLARFLSSRNLSRGIRTGALYRRTVSLDVPIRTAPFTKFHPDEKSGMGGGWSTADGLGFRQGLLACAKRYRHYWQGHEFWVEGYGRAVIGDNGPGWSSKYQFDIAAFSGPEVDKLDAGPGHLNLRYIVVSCPRPNTCDCDFARAWRKHR